MNPRREGSSIIQPAPLGSHRDKKMKFPSKETAERLLNGYVQVQGNSQGGEVLVSGCGGFINVKESDDAAPAPFAASCSVEERFCLGQERPCFPGEAIISFSPPKPSIGLTSPRALTTVA